MKTEPLFDRNEIEQIIRSAKSNRVKFLQRDAAKVGGATRWGALGAMAAACLTLLAGRGIFSPPG